MRLFRRIRVWDDGQRLLTKLKAQSEYQPDKSGYYKQAEVTLCN